MTTYKERRNHSRFVGSPFLRYPDDSYFVFLCFDALTLESHPYLCDSPFTAIQHFRSHYGPEIDIFCIGAFDAKSERFDHWADSYLVWTYEDDDFSRKVRY